MPLSTSPVPAVASRASPSTIDAHAAVGRRRRRWWGPSAGRPRRSRRRARGPRRAGRRSGRCPASRSYSPSWGVSTVGRPGRRGPAPRRSPRAVSPSPSTTAGRSAPASTSSTADRVADVGAETRARSTSAWNRRRASSTSSAQPRGGQLEPDGLGGPSRVVGHARASRGAPCRRRRAGAAAAARWPAPVMPGEPATTSTLRRPLVGGRVARRAASRRRRRPPRPPPRARRRRGRCRRPRPRRPATSRLEHRPGFSAANVTVRTADRAPAALLAGRARRRRSGCRRRAPGAPPGSGASVLAAEPGAVGGIDDEVGGGQPGGRVRGVDHLRRARPRRRSRRAAARPSAPLLPLPATTTTRRPYAAAEQVERVRAPPRRRPAR